MAGGRRTGNTVWGWTGKCRRPWAGMNVFACSLLLGWADAVAVDWRARGRRGLGRGEWRRGGAQRRAHGVQHCKSKIPSSPAAACCAPLCRLCSHCRGRARRGGRRASSASERSAQCARENTRESHSVTLSCRLPLSRELRCAGSLAALELDRAHIAHSCGQRGHAGGGDGGISCSFLAVATIGVYGVYGACVRSGCG